VYDHPTIFPRNVDPVASPTGLAGCAHSGDAEITVRARQPVFENTVFSVYADHIADKNGNEVLRYLSVVPRCLLADSIAGVAVLPVRDGKIGLVRVYRHPLGKWSWEAIKGHAEPGEGPRDAAARELCEESGFSVAPESFIDLGAIVPEGGVIEGRSRLFVARLPEKAGKVVAPELGHGEMVFYSQDKMDDLIERGEIEDASTVVLLLKHARMLEPR
jgi:8-oxo-dGTP pyrophosphatase MutT (NUDIX family)